MELSSIPDGIFNQSPALKLVGENINEATFAEWSKHISQHLGIDSSTINQFLHVLADAYKSCNIEVILRFIDKIKIWPGDPWLSQHSFSDHINYVCGFLTKASTIASPKIPFIGFPKSASSYVNSVVCELLGVDPTVISYDHNIGMKAWVNSFMRFGGITHDHFLPKKENLDLLINAAIKKCVIHTRHPMDSLVSFYHHIKKDNKELNMDLCKYVDNNMTQFLQFYASWHDAWTSISNKIQIVFVNFETMLFERDLYFKGLLKESGIIYDANKLNSIIEKYDENKYSNEHFNFRNGKCGTWRDSLSKSQVANADKLMKDFKIQYYS